MTITVSILFGFIMALVAITAGVAVSHYIFEFIPAAGFIRDNVVGAIGGMCTLMVLLYFALMFEVRSLAYALERRISAFQKALTGEEDES